MVTESELSDFVTKVSVGVLNQFEGDCKRQQARLSEFLAKQTELLNTLDHELIKFKSAENLQLEDMIYILKTCQTRLHTIKDRMRKASAISAKLKARSLRIQQIKQKQALDRELQREAQLKREQDMVANSSLHSSANLLNPSTSSA